MTHEERSAATRTRLIEAAINCLRTYGYSATTTTLVAEMAGLSRGAMLHQFGTKVDLMLAVARHVVEQQNAFVVAELEKYPVGRARFVAMTDVTWQALKQPDAIALLEIMMASRSDAELGEQFPAVAQDLDASQRRITRGLARAAGIDDQATIDVMGQLHRAAMQGLSVLMMFSHDEEALEPLLELLKTYKEFLTDKLIAEAREA